MFIAAFLTIAKEWKQLRPPLMGEPMVLHPRPGGIKRS